MKYLLIENENGQYNKDGKNYDILECNNAIGARAKEFIEFDSIDEVKEYYNLINMRDE